MLLYKHFLLFSALDAFYIPFTIYWHCHNVHTICKFVVTDDRIPFKDDYALFMYNIFVNLFVLCRISLEHEYYFRVLHKRENRQLNDECLLDTISMNY